MDFHKLSNLELQEFVSAYPQYALDPLSPLSERAARLFEIIKTLPVQFPDPVVDLYLATYLQVQKPTTKYTELQLNSLTPEQVRIFSNVYKIDSSDIQRAQQRIIRILKWSDLVAPNQQVQAPVFSKPKAEVEEVGLFESNAFNRLCDMLSFEELQNFRTTRKGQNIDCVVGITDPDGKLNSLNGVNDATWTAYKKIQEIGSTSTLFWAVYERDLEVLAALLKSGLNPETVDVDGKTALYLAVELRLPEMVKVLLELGADPNFQLAGIGLDTNAGDTPLILAVQMTNLDIIDLLLSHGADVNLADSLGYTPYRLAEISQKDQVLARLELAKAR